MNNQARVNQELLKIVLRKPLLRIEVKEWADTLNGNTYWASRSWIAGEAVARLPFQYGYERHGLHITLEALAAVYFDGRESSVKISDIQLGLGVNISYEKMVDCTQEEVERWGSKTP